MTQRNHEYDEVLRRALRSAADLVEPSADGLERIRARLTTPRPAPFAWVLVWYAEAVSPVLGYLQPFLAWLQATLSPVIERFKPERPDAAHPQRRYAWLRPAAAMGTAVFVVAMGAFALTALPQVISQSGAFILPIISGGSGGNGASASPFGQGSPLTGGAPSTGATTGFQTGQTQQTPGCPRVKRGHPVPSTSPSTGTSSPSPSASPTTSPSPTGTATPTPTSTDTTTPSTTSSSPNPAGAVPSPDGPAAAPDSPTPTPDAAPQAAFPAGVTASTPPPTPCKATRSPAKKKKHISTQPGSGVAAISHAKARRAT
jgi:hypothetical protein